MKKMTRRGFFNVLRGAPLLAVPSLALSVAALNDSKKASDRMNDIVLNGDKTIIQGCSFTMTGNLQLNGDHQTISDSSFQMNPNYETPMISMGGAEYRNTIRTKPKDYEEALGTFSSSSWMLNK